MRCSNHDSIAKVAFDDIHRCAVKAGITLRPSTRLESLLVVNLLADVAVEIAEWIIWLEFGLVRHKPSYFRNGITDLVVNKLYHI